MKLGQKEAAGAKVYRLSRPSLTMTLSSMSASNGHPTHRCSRLASPKDSDGTTNSSVSLEFPLLDHHANPRDEPICSSFVRLTVSLNFMQGGIDSEARKRIMELESRICELQRA
jgi:hypothetical protein